MVLAYPRDMTSAYSWQVGGLRLQRSEQHSRSRNGTQTADIADPLWRGDYRSIAMDYAEAVALHAQFSALASRSFWAHTPEQSSPAYDPSPDTLDSVLVASISGDRDTIAFKGLPADFVVTVGDFYSIDQGGETYSLHQAVEGVSADANGDTTQFAVVPNLPAGVSVDDPVTANTPLVEMRLEADTLALTSVSGRLLWLVSFSCLQVMQ